MTIKQFGQIVQLHMDNGLSVSAARAKAQAMLEGRPLLDESGNQVDLDQVQLLAPNDNDNESDPANHRTESATLQSKNLQTMIDRAVSTAIADQTQPPAKSKAAKVIVSGAAPRNDDDRRAGFKHIGQLAYAVKNWVLDPKDMDQRLKACISTKAPTNVSVTSIGSDGGFLIPDAFRTELLSHAFNENSIFPRCRQLSTNGNSLELPKDETVPWGTDGVQVNWTQENSALSDSKLKIGTIDIKLHKLAALVPVSNELLDDAAVALDAYLNHTTPRKVQYKVDDAIMNGTGAGQPMGIRNAGSLKTVSRTTATGIAIDEVADLMAAHPSWSLGSAAFVTHSTVLPDIIKAQVGNFPVFMAPGALESTSVPGRLMGRPLLVHEAAQARDNAGDLALHDFSQYVCVTKSHSPVRSDMSVHLYFDRDLTAFRFTMRIGGQPWLASTISQDNGGGTVSPFAEIGAT